MATEWETRARNMVESQLRGRGINDPRVLDAMLHVPRHAFVPEALRPLAYDDRPLPIGETETISQPYIVAAMTQAARVNPGDKALEIGTGSGYQAAILAYLGATVYTIEKNPRLAREAIERLHDLGYAGVHAFCGDGSEGLPEHGPYNIILVTAGAPSVSPVLLDQMAESSRLVAPVGGLERQQLLVLLKQGGEVQTHALDPCQFVPLVGKGGWPESAG